MPTDPLIGTTIDGEYRVDSLVGEGGFGAVYRCSELQLGRQVALKIVRRGLGDPRDVDRFLAEGRILASVNHPNLTQIYRLGYHEERPYIIMEFLSGRVLRELLDGPRLQLARALDIMRQVARGLEAIHEKGIVHRDLSANNIMVTDADVVKILDLGLARNLNALSTVSGEGRLVGSVPYISPEQIHGQGTTASADIFAFGILLFQILTGRHPFHAEHYMSLMYNIAHREPATLAEFLEAPPPALAQLVETALVKDPGARAVDATRIIAILDEMLGDPQLGDAAAARPVESPAGERPGSERNPYLNRVMIRRFEDFVGRTHEVRRIFSRLNATPPGSVSILGDRKIGKSSLLNYIYMKRNRERMLDRPDRMLMVFMDLQEQKSMSMESFCRTMIGMAQYELRDRMDVSDCAAGLDGIKCMVQKLHAGGFHLAILFDEFDVITSNPAFDLEFFSFLRFLANHYNVAYMTSSARDLQTLCHTKEISDSPFFNIFSTMRLSVFREEEALELIGAPSARVGRPLASHADAILGLTGRFPFFIQIACSHCIDYLEENPGREAPDLEEVRRRFYEEARFHYRYIWDNLDEHERSAIQRVARGKSIPAAFRHVLQELEGRHLIEEVNGRAKLFAPTFDRFVEEEASSRRPSFLGRLLGRGGR